VLKLPDPDPYLIYRSGFTYLTGSDPTTLIIANKLNCKSYLFWKAELAVIEERARDEMAKKESELRRLEMGVDDRKSKHHQTMHLLGQKKKVRKNQLSKSNGICKCLWQCSRAGSVIIWSLGSGSSHFLPKIWTFLLKMNNL